MTGWRRADLVNEMYREIFEEAPLWSIGDSITDYLGRGETITHGPFSRAECSELLTRWYDLGWLDLVAFTDPELSRRDSNGTRRLCRSRSCRRKSVADYTESLDHRVGRWRRHTLCFGRGRAAPSRQVVTWSSSGFNHWQTRAHRLSPWQCRDEMMSTNSSSCSIRWLDRTWMNSGN
jgi:hypothetical protein